MNSGDDSESKLTGERADKDTRSVAELLEASVDWTDDDWGSSRTWRAVAELQRRGTREVLEGALALCKSRDSRVRARGADILAQLGIPDRTFPEECLSELIRLLQQDDSPRVLESAAIGLGHQYGQKDLRAIPALVAHKNHPDMNVRHGVASGLGGYNEPDAVAVLIELMEDPADLVRDWATFGLGALCSADNAAIRDALLLRLADRDEDVRFEALSGLAERRDPRVITPLIAELEASPERDTLLDLARLLLGEKSRSEGLAAGEIIEALRALN